MHTYHLYTYTLNLERRTSSTERLLSAHVFHSDPVVPTLMTLNLNAWWNMHWAARKSSEDSYCICWTEIIIKSFYTSRREDYEGLWNLMQQFTDKHRSKGLLCKLSCDSLTFAASSTDFILSHCYRSISITLYHSLFNHLTGAQIIT